MSRWSKMRFEAACKEIYRYPTYYGIEYVKDGVIEVRGEMLKKDGTINIDKGLVRCINEETSLNFPRTILEEGDVVMSVRGTIGKIGYVTNEVANANITANLLRISPDRSKINEQYFFQLLMSDNFKMKLESITEATTIKTFKVPRLKEIELVLPPLQEQRKIASILFSVDEAIKKTEAIIEQSEKVKKGLMQKLLTEGIGHKKFKKTDIGKVPETWGVKKVEEIGIVGTGGTPKRDDPKNYGGSIPWIKTTEIKYNLVMKPEEYITEYALENSAAKLYPAGTVLLAMYGQGVTRGRCAILGIDAATNQACAAIVTKQGMINKFLYYVLELNYETLRNLGHGSNQSNLNTRFVKSFRVPVPPIHEQENIIKIIASIESKLMIEIRNLEELKKIKVGLMQSLLTGKVRVKVNEAEVTQV
ncbi:restriction endonuclease subunit S [Bacillus zanthoxyli]